MANVTFNLENKELVIAIEDKVDSNNAAEVEAKINEIVANEHDSLVLDFDKLNYISSAGLRVVLRLKKENNNFKVINCSSDVYEIFEMTGFSEIMEVEKGYRKLSVDGCAAIGKGAKGTVYRYNDDTIIKVYHDNAALPAIKNERDLARKAFVLGIPTAIPYDIVKVEDKFGSVFELLDAKSYSKLILANPDNMDEYIKQYAELLKQIHQTIVKEDDMPDIKNLINKWYDQCKEQLDVNDANKLRKLIDETPDTLNMLHCDYHTNNIMMQNGETLLIDMDTLSHGHPIFELANVYITYIGFGIIDEKYVENFIGLPFEISKQIWNKFLPFYLNTTDPVRIKEVEDKTKLLCDMRLIRHVTRRGINNENDAKAVEFAKNEIHTLLTQIDSLDF